MAGVVELEIPARPELLSLARLVVATAASVEPTFQDERIEDLRVVVSEATTNAIAAHAELSGEERIIITCRVEADRVEVAVRDKGPGFDPGRLQPLPGITEEARLDVEGGFGIPLMQSLADEAEIRSSPEGTSVTLTVHRRRPG